MDSTNTNVKNLLSKVCLILTNIKEKIDSLNMKL